MHNLGEIINLSGTKISRNVMRVLKLFSILVTLTFLMSSCFLFKKKHERCPAYGGANFDKEKYEAPVKATDVVIEEEKA